MPVCRVGLAALYRRVSMLGLLSALCFSPLRVPEVSPGILNVDRDQKNNKEALGVLPEHLHRSVEETWVEAAGILQATQMKGHRVPEGGRQWGKEKGLAV